LQQARLGERAQVRRGGGWRHLDPVDELVEPAGAVERLAHDQHRAAGAHQAHRPLDRAVRVERDRGPGFGIGPAFGGWVFGCWVFGCWIDWL